MADRSLKEFIEFVAANPKMHWGDCSCTPVLEFDENGKTRDVVRRCAITADGMTTIVHMPHRVKLGTGEHWAPQTVLSAIEEVIGPEAEME